MLRTLITTAFFTLLFGVTGYAAEDVVSVDYGKEKPKGFSFESKFNKGLNSFSLRSGRQFRGDNVINEDISFNAKSFVPTRKVQSPNTIQLKKGLIINSITFNPNEAVKGYNIK